MMWPVGYVGWLYPTHCNWLHDEVWMWTSVWEHLSNFFGADEGNRRQGQLENKTCVECARLYEDGYHLWCSNKLKSCHSKVDMLVQHSPASWRQPKSAYHLLAVKICRTQTQILRVFLWWFARDFSHDPRIISKNCICYMIDSVRALSSKPFWPPLYLLQLGLAPERTMPNHYSRMRRILWCTHAS